MKKKIIIGLSCLAFSAVGVAACGTSTGGDTNSTTVDHTTQGVATNADNSSDSDNRTYNVVEYIKSGKPLIVFFKDMIDDTIDKSDRTCMRYIIKGDTLYYCLSDDNKYMQIDMTYGEYAKINDEDAYERIIEQAKDMRDYYTEKPYVLAVYSDSSGNYIDSIIAHCPADKGYQGWSIYRSGNGLNRTDQIYDSTLFKFEVKEDAFVFRSNNPEKYIGTIDDYKNMEGVLIDPSEDEIYAALGVEKPTTTVPPETTGTIAPATPTTVPAATTISGN